MSKYMLSSIIPNLGFDSQKLQCSAGMRGKNNSSRTDALNRGNNGENYLCDLNLHLTHVVSAFNKRDVQLRQDTREQVNLLKEPTVWG